MNTTLNKMAARSSMLSFIALSFVSTTLLGANGSDNVIQGIITPIVPNWVETPALVTPAAPAPQVVQAAPVALVPEETEYLPPKAARN